LLPRLLLQLRHVRPLLLLGLLLLLSPQLALLPLLICARLGQPALLRCSPILLVPGQLSSRRAPTLPLAPLARLPPGLPILLLLLLAILLLRLPLPILLQLLPISRRRSLHLLLPRMRCLVLPLTLAALLVVL
jgi:hypothetical protein